MFSNRQFGVEVGGFIMERTVLNFFFFPFLRFGKWFISNKESSSRLIVLAYFSLAWLLALFFAGIRKKLTPLEKDRGYESALGGFTMLEALFFAFVCVYTLFSFIFSHQIRFFLPAVLMLALLLVLLFDKLYSFLKHSFSEARFREFIAATLLGLNLIFTIIFLGNFHYFHVKYYYFLGYYTDEEYVEEIGGQ